MSTEHSVYTWAYNIILQMSWDWGLAPGSTESLRLIRFSRLPGLSGSPGTPGFQVYQVLFVLQVSMFIRFSRFPGLSGPPGYKVALFIRFSMFSGSTDVLQVLQIDLQVLPWPPGWIWSLRSWKIQGTVFYIFGRFGLKREGLMLVNSLQVQ